MKPLLACLALVAVASASPLLAQSDTLPPRLLDLDFAPSTVDVSLAPQTVLFSLHVVDDLSGFWYGSVMLMSPSGSQRVSGSAGPESGIILDGTWGITVRFPLYAEPGDWRLTSVTLWDGARNRVTLNGMALSAAGFPTTVQVIDANPDTEGPLLSSVTFSPTSVDVSEADAAISVDLALTDDLSGVVPRTTAFADFELLSPSGQQSRFVSSFEFTRLSGTPTNGVWHATLLMQRYSEPGVWKVASVSLQDAAGNVRLYTPESLAGLGSSIEVAVASSPADSTPPTVNGLSFTPTFINTSLGPQVVQVELDMSDDLSGVSFDPCTSWYSMSWGAGFQSPSGGQRTSTDFSFAGTPPYSGTPLDGVWRFEVGFPQYSEEGTWRVSWLQLKDRVRNLVMLGSPGAVASLGFPTELTVIRPSLVPDGSISDPAAGGTVADATFGDRARIVVPAGVLSVPTSIAIDVLQSPLGIPLPSGFSSAETYYVNVQLTPAPAFPLPAPGLTVVLPLRNYAIPGTGISLFRVETSTGALVPAESVSGDPVVGVVDAGGLTATFGGVARCSTIVGVLPDAISVSIDIKPGEASAAINTKSMGTTPVAIFSTPTFDVSKVDPSTIRFSGAAVARTKQGRFQVSVADVNEDGLDDLIVHFETRALLLGVSDVEGVLEGRTADGRVFRGTGPVDVIR